MYWCSFLSELQHLFSPLYIFLMFWKTASFIFDQIDQHNFTCFGEKQRKLASQGKTAKNILEILLVTCFTKDRDLSLQSVFLWTWANYHATNGSIMSRHLSIQTKSEIGWHRRQTTWLVCVFLRRTQKYITADDNALSVKVLKEENNNQFSGSFWHSYRPESAEMAF